mmetsp:Transcript_5108/g.12875  ORF Transcript_5108/g.12875 Transcript_5108/m.12875 type:complete len:294 (-) Transcript_5108:3335-4216(-)
MPIRISSLGCMACRHDSTKGLPPTPTPQCCGQTPSKLAERDASPCIESCMLNIESKRSTYRAPPQRAAAATAAEGKRTGLGSLSSATALRDGLASTATRAALAGAAATSVSIGLGRVPDPSFDESGLAAALRNTTMAWPTYSGSYTTLACARLVSKFARSLASHVSVAERLVEEGGGFEVQGEASISVAPPAAAAAAARARASSDASAVASGVAVFDSETSTRSYISMYAELGRSSPPSLAEPPNVSLSKSRTSYQSTRSSSRRSQTSAPCCKDRPHAEANATLAARPRRTSE